MLQKNEINCSEKLDAWARRRFAVEDQIEMEDWREEVDEIFDLILFHVYRRWEHHVPYFQ